MLVRWAVRVPSVVVRPLCIALVPLVAHLQQLLVHLQQPGGPSVAKALQTHCSKQASLPRVCCAPQRVRHRMTWRVRLRHSAAAAQVLVVSV